LYVRTRLRLFHDCLVCLTAFATNLPSVPAEGRSHPAVVQLAPETQRRVLPDILSGRFFAGCVEQTADPTVGTTAIADTLRDWYSHSAYASPVA
jgi:hypothetical protein